MNNIQFPIKAHRDHINIRRTMGNASAKIYIISISHISLHCFTFIFVLLFGILSGHNSTINYELERMINKIIYIQHFVVVLLYQ